MGYGVLFRKITTSFVEKKNEEKKDEKKKLEVGVVIGSI